jgi:ADP-ribosylglycohydrolase
MGFMQISGATAPLPTDNNRNGTQSTPWQATSSHEDRFNGKMLPKQCSFWERWLGDKNCSSSLKTAPKKPWYKRPFPLISSLVGLIGGGILIYLHRAKLGNLLGKSPNHRAKGTISPLPQSLASVSIDKLFSSDSNSRARRAMQYCFWGDAAGAPIENLPAEAIAQLEKGRFTDKQGHTLPQVTPEQFINFTAPKQSYTGYKDHTGRLYIYGHQKPGKPEVTDDSLMAALAFIATKAENSSEKINEKYFNMLSAEYNQGLVDRAQAGSTGRRGFGGNTVKAINNPNMSLDQKGKAASNGAMPAIIGYLSALPPSKLAQLCKNPQPLVEHCANISRLTHNSRQREEATAAYALLFAHILNKEKTDEATILKIFEDIASSTHISDPQIKALFQRAHFNSTKYPDYSRVRDHSAGSALDALGLCTWILKNYWNKDPKAALAKILEHGKDTDSNAALALGLLGATTSQEGKMPKDIERKINEWAWE